MPALALAACDTGSEMTAPNAPGPRPPSIGIIGGQADPASLIGAWVRHDEVDDHGTTLLRTTEWRFDGRGTCRLIVTLVSATDIVPFVEESVCLYEAASSTITIRFDRSGEIRLRWKLDGPDALLLDGERYVRARR